MTRRRKLRDPGGAIAIALVAALTAFLWLGAVAAGSTAGSGLAAGLTVATLYLVRSYKRLPARRADRV